MNTIKDNVVFDNKEEYLRSLVASMTDEQLAEYIAGDPLDCIRKVENEFFVSGDSEDIYRMSEGSLLEAAMRLKRMSAALTEIADDTCIDSDGNKQIALRGLGRTPQP